MWNSQKVEGPLVCGGHCEYPFGCDVSLPLVSPTSLFINGERAVPPWVFQATKYNSCIEPDAKPNTK